MKPKQLTQKLALNKKTITNLDQRAMTQLKGGVWSYDTCAVTDMCPTDSPCISGLPKCECTGMCTFPCVTTDTTLC
jgi:hypothetical protein